MKPNNLSIFLAFSISVLLTGCKTEAPASTDPGLSRADVQDLGNLFSPEEESQLADSIRAFESGSGLDLVVVTVGDPGEGGIAAFALEMIRKIQPGKPGMNNGAIIYLSEQVREVKVEVGHGLEWMVSDTTAGLVIEQMRPFLAQQQYLPALFVGLRQLAAEGAAIRWELSSPDSLLTGNIVRIPVKGFPRAYQEGVPEQAQFHPNYFIEVALNNDSSLVPLFFSGYMRDLADRIVYGEGQAVVTALVLQEEPLLLGLMGLDTGS